MSGRYDLAPPSGAGAKGRGPSVQVYRETARGQRVSIRQQLRLGEKHGFRGAAVVKPGFGREGRGDDGGDTLASEARLQHDGHAAEHAVRLGRCRRVNDKRGGPDRGIGPCSSNDNSTGEYNGLHDAPRHGTGDRALEEGRRSIAAIHRNGALQNAKQELMGVRRR